MICCFVTGWSVENHTAVPVHWLAWTGNSEFRRRLYRIHWSCAENQGTVWSGRTYYSPLQV